MEAAWIESACLAWEGNDPAALLEVLMSSDECPAFGPVHHVLVGAALLTCSCTGKDGAAARDSLANDLAELERRAACVPGAACARWGVCGAAASCGMAFAIMAGNAPLRREGWSEGQLMVADILQQIARAGAPRCCKRDARIAVRAAAPWFNRELGTHLAEGDAIPSCSVFEANSACLQGACPYHPGA